MTALTHNRKLPLQSMHRFLRAAGVALLLVILASVAQGAPLPPASPAQFIQKLGEDALTARRLPAEERSERVLSLIRDDIDVPAIGRFMLGRHWREASEEQRARYLGLLEGQLLKTYNSRFGGQSFRVAHVAPAGAGETLVTSEISQNNGRRPVTVEWRVREEGGRLKIEDMAVDGFSISIEHRDTFSAIVERGGIEALLTTLQNN